MALSRKADLYAKRSESQVSAAVSTGRCNTGLKFLRWRLILQGLSWSLVKLACDSAEFGLGKSGYISAFGKILSEKAIGIFVAPALPRSLRITKIESTFVAMVKFRCPAISDPRSQVRDL
jgi:hypothetical protein